MYRKNSRTWLAACVSFDYSKETVEMIHAGYMTIGLNLESDLPEVDSHLIAAKPYLAKEEIGFHFPMYAKTLDSILNESVVPKNIDLLSIDVEDSEIEVLKRINFNNYTCQYILIECPEVMKIEKFLAIHGYFLVEKLTSADYLFAHRKYDSTF